MATNQNSDCYSEVRNVQRAVNPHIRYLKKLMGLALDDACLAINGSHNIWNV
ncbi:hypothetical protein KOR42_55310 [Thalassoglobus neptunius]|uniref:Uncharacterized protein n=2 Tax=Thalassoglobus neptunius TaxID=1938619 RepID=A0A5C5UTI0_9PLAN|nr:hypothetical protein KOR42_55310 [Thalassoglobus neptunius]